MEAYTSLKIFEDPVSEDFNSGKIVFRTKSEFNDILVLDKDNIRHLYFLGGKHCKTQSAINISNLKEDVFECNKIMKHSLDLVVSPKRVLVIGMGAGIIPRYVSERLPEITIDVVDIDKEIFFIAEEYFHFNKTENTNYLVGDCYQVCREIKTKYDIIISDIFSKDYIPYQAMSLEFFQTIKTILLEKGIYCCNSAGWHVSFDSHIYTLSNVFGDNIWVINDSKDLGNSVMFCSNGKIKMDFPKYDLSNISNKIVNRLFCR